MDKEKVCSVGITLILFWMAQLPIFQWPQNFWPTGKVISHNKQLTFLLIITFQWYWAWLSTCIIYHNQADKRFSRDHCHPLSRVYSLVWGHWGHYWHSLCTLIMYIHYAHSLCTFIMHIHYAHALCTFIRVSLEYPNYPKSTQSTNDFTQPTQSNPKSTQSNPKSTQSQPKVTQNQPKVT